MSGKATVVAPSNIAFVKYWGTRDLERTLPYNPSLSMTLSACATTTTVEHRESEGHEVLLAHEDGRLEPPPESFARDVTRHLDRLRAWAGAEGGFRVATRNSFPTGAGIASSASGFAALTLATVAALGRTPPADELTILARRSGSGSAARSVLGGYVEWPAPRAAAVGASADRTSATPEPAAAEAPAAVLRPASHWELRNVIAVLESGVKLVSSREGHARAPSSPYFEPRLTLLGDRLDRVRRAVVARSFADLAPVVEEEAIDLHLIAMSSRPPIFYWHPGTLRVLEAARRLRQAGVEVCATMDAGPNVHLICAPAAEAAVMAALGAIAEVRQVLRDRVGEGPRASDEHLF